MSNEKTHSNSLLRIAFLELTTLKLIISYCLFLGSTFAISAQTTKDTIPNNKINIEYANVKGSVQNGKLTRILVGNKNRQIELYQKNTWVYCDTAVLEENNLDARGNVVIQQGDSINIFADSLKFEGNTRIAELFGDVILSDGNQELFTDHLVYDLDTKIATYSNGAVLKNDESQLVSQRGTYNVETSDVFFKGNVELTNPKFNLNADTLLFNTQSEIATFLGPTNIDLKKKGTIYCEKGFYDTQKNYAEFETNAQYIKDKQHATADKMRYDGKANNIYLEGNAYAEEDERKIYANTIWWEGDKDITHIEGDARVIDGEQDISADIIRYNSKTKQYTTEGKTQFFKKDQYLKADQTSYNSDTETLLMRGNVIIINKSQIINADSVDYQQSDGIGKARGHVVWTDTSSNISINCNAANYNEQTGYILAYGRPLLKTVLDNDTLYLSADTLLSLQEQDSSRLLIANKNVKVYKSDLQAICDSLRYSNADSLFQFFKNPIIWSDTSQFSADTIRMKLQNGSLNKIFLIKKAFIINEADANIHNQIKGKDITASFIKNNLRIIDVRGNGESIYYIQDEQKSYIGINQSICSEMKIIFDNNQVQNIKFFTQPIAKLTPIKEAIPSKFKLDDFNWEMDKRPNSIDDLR